MPDSRALSDRAAVTLLFFLNGALFSSFVARLPAIKADLGASGGQLGIALVFATGPALIGLLSDASSLRLALVLVVGLLALSSALGERRALARDGRGAF